MEVARALFREKNQHLNRFYDEVQSLDFYREIIPICSFERAGYQENEKANGKLRNLSGEQPCTYIVTDEPQTVAELQGCSMAVMSCEAYFEHHHDLLFDERRQEIDEILDTMDL